MPLKLQDLATGSLASDLTVGQLTMVLTGGHTLPTLVAGEYFPIGLVHDVTRQVEIARATFNAAANTYDLVRPAPLGVTIPTGSVVELRVVKDLFDHYLPLVGGIMSGNLQILDGKEVKTESSDQQVQSRPVRTQWLHQQRRDSHRQIGDGLHLPLDGSQVRRARRRSRRYGPGR
jgi:hypothetical protein